MTILFTCAGRRNYLLKYFKEAKGNDDKIIAVDSDLYASALAEADYAFKVPSVNHPDYLKVLDFIITTNKVDMVIPLNDLELEIMSDYKMTLVSKDVQIVVSDPNVIDLCADKWKTYNFFSKMGIATPLSFLNIEDVFEALSKKKIKYPLILKPRWGSASIGIEEVESNEELRLKYELLKMKIRKSGLEKLYKGGNDSAIIFQEKIIGIEYGIDIVNDFQGRYYGAFVRQKLTMRSGETDKAISVIDDKFSAIAKKIAEATRHIGIMDCDFFIKDNEIYFLEMNARFGGGYPFSHVAGIDLPSIYLAWSQGQTDVQKYNNYRANQVSSKCDRIVKIKNEILGDFNGEIPVKRIDTLL